MDQEQPSGDIGGLARLQYAETLPNFGDLLPDLPVLRTTRLQLELLLKDAVIDLKAVTEVILADLGATLQILRVVGREFAAVEGRPDRMEDSIVSLSAGRCYQIVCAAADVTAWNAYASEWQDCRLRAECARDLAKEREGFPPEEAYLVGLLYRIGAIPQLLGWSLSESSGREHRALGVMLAFHWNLPDCVMLAIKEHHEVASTSKWRELLRLAEERARQSAS